MAGSDGPQQQLDLLRDLLNIERSTSEQRRQNNQRLQSYIEQLRSDFLRQQSDVVQALEFCHKLKGQKEAQLACLEASLKEKDALIEQLQQQLANLDGGKLRSEFKASLDRQQELKQLEHEQLAAQLKSLEQQLDCERNRTSQVAAQLNQKLGDQLRAHEGELASARERLEASQRELERVLGEPQNLVIKALREDKSALGTRVHELQMALDESRANYEAIKERVDALLAEQKRLEQQSRDQVDVAHAAHCEQRRALQEVKLELEDKDELNQVLQFNLGRSEKRVKNLISALKMKEASYRELMAARDSKQAQELDKLRGEQQQCEKRLIECESELAKRGNELARARLELESQLESLRNERDERVQKVSLEKGRLEQELKALELRLARELEQANGTARCADELRRELEQMRAESKRLSIELTKSEAKLYARQQEVAQLNGVLEEQREELKAAADRQATGGSPDKVARELESERQSARRLRGQLDALRKDNEKLHVKLKMAEANLDQMGSVLNREHAKMMLDFEKKLELIRTEQVAFDKNKLRYKRYGYKLKKYCEHLKRVHEHLCAPDTCGYMMMERATGEELAGAGAGRLGHDQRHLLGASCDSIDGSAEEGDIYEEINEEEEEAAWAGSSQSLDARSLQCDTATERHGQMLTPHSAGRFLIKRTGDGHLAQGHSPSAASKHKIKKPSSMEPANQQQQQPQQHHSSREPLKARNLDAPSLLRDGPQASQGVHTVPGGASCRQQPHRQQQLQMLSTRGPRNDDRHAYYYIRADKFPSPSPSCLSKRSSARSQQLGVNKTPPVACRETKLTAARSRARMLQAQQAHSQAAAMLRTMI